MEIKGIIKLIKDTHSVTDSFSKRELVLDTEGDYPQSILIEFVQDKCDLLGAFKAGQEVEISINIRGREWINPEGEARYFNSIQGWRIKALEAAPKVEANGSDDLPFG